VSAEPTDFRDSMTAHFTRDTIYLFHMPLFFMVSGYFARRLISSMDAVRGSSLPFGHQGQQARFES
jgi:hypothetical protein